jgi:RNA polymerase sigma-70 factor, ECF subfamily
MGLDSPQIVRLLMAERSRLFAYIWAIVGDAHLAEDVFQEVSLLAIEKGGEVADEPRLRVWLRRAARNKALQAVRQITRRPAPLDESAIEKLEEYWVRYDATPESDLIETLRECIRLLTPNSRKLMVLRYSKGLQSSQIAQRLKRQVAAVRRSIARAHRTLHDCVRARLAAKSQSHHDE